MQSTNEPNLMEIAIFNEDNENEIRRVIRWESTKQMNINNNKSKFIDRNHSKIVVYKWYGTEMWFKFAKHRAAKFEMSSN